MWYNFIVKKVNKYKCILYYYKLKKINVLDLKERIYYGYEGKRS